MSTDSIPVITGTLPVGGKGVAVGQHAEVRRTFTVEQVGQFGKLIGDENPLHSPQTCFPESFQVLETAGIITWENNKSKVLVHGMMAGSLFSCIFGTLIPGSVYRSQQLAFRLPIFCNQVVTGQVVVTRVRTWREGVVLTCDTKVVCQERECITGQASVWLPNGEIFVKR
jgi:acyl dehydratase